MIAKSDSNVLDIVIYVVIIAAGIIGNAYKAYQKNKEKEKRKHATDPFPDIFGDERTEKPEKDIWDFEELIEVPKVEQKPVYVPSVATKVDLAVESIEYTPRKVVPIRHINIEDEDNEIYNFNIEALSDIKNIEIGNIDTDIDNDSFIGDLIEDFDGTKAIIYSEIINRPKYLDQAS